MQLPNDLIAQFAKLASASDTREPETKTQYGRIKVSNKNTYVVIDGSPAEKEITTPISSTVEVKDGDRVTLQIKDHKVIITGNVTNPTIGSNYDIPYGTTETGSPSSTPISNLGIAVAETIRSEVATINRIYAESIESNTAEINKLKVKDVEISGDLNTANGKITNLEADYAKITGNLEAANAEIDKLKVTEGDFRSLESDYAIFRVTTTESLEAGVADIEKLKTDKLDATWANIDYSKIDKAVLKEFHAASGLIENVVMEDGTVTGHLVAVTIRGDLIESNTLVADKLVIKGVDGLYYKLNFESGNFTDAEEVPTDGLHGSVIVAKSITAEKVAVSDLVAFGATIGGFTITDDSLYSGVKESVDNSTRGTYIDADGQFVVGDAFNYIKFYKLTDETGNPVLDDSGEPIYKLEISADSILFGDGVKSSAEDIKALTEHVKIGTITDENGDEKPCVELSEGDTDFKQVITNTKTMFMDGSRVGTEIDAEGVHTENLSVDKEIRHNNNNKTGGYVWAFRSNGNYGLSWKSEVNS